MQGAVIRGSWMMKAAGMCAAAGLTGAAPALAQPGLTPVQSNPLEPSHQAIIESAYGAQFQGDPGAGFVSVDRDVPVVLTRATDFGLGGILDVAGGDRQDADDEVWHDGVISITARARFASFAQDFGFFAGEGSATPFQNLLSVTGGGFDSVGHAPEFDIGAVTHTWRWARSGDGDTFSSRPSDNPGERDHMVSYRVSGLDNGFAATWLLFFEDQGIADGSDWDYNDLVVEINVRAVPAPGGVGLAMAMGLLMARRRRG